MFGEEENNTTVFCISLFLQGSYINTFVCIGKSRSSIKRQLQSTKQACILFFRDILKEAAYLNQTILLSCFSTTPYKSFHKSSHPAFIDLNSIWVALGLTFKLCSSVPSTASFFSLSCKYHLTRADVFSVCSYSCIFTFHQERWNRPANRQMLEMGIFD